MDRSTVAPSRASPAGFFAAFDLLLSPTTSCPARPPTQPGPPMIGGRPAGQRDHAAFTAQFDNGHGPAGGIPCDATAAGLPSGLQIAAGVGRDRVALAAARTFETAPAALTGAQRESAA